MTDSMNPTEAAIINHTADASDDPTMGIEPVEAAPQPVYKVMGDSKRPVAKSSGSLWKSRLDAGQAKMRSTGKFDNWDEAIRYYKNDQRKGRVGSGERVRSKKSDRGTADTENIVFSNVSALVPSTYAKNPSCEITTNWRDDKQPDGADDELERIATTAERLVNTLAAAKAAPGLNLKPKARKSVVMVQLTNAAYIEIGYTFKDVSSEQALTDLDNAAAKLASAKDSKEIEEAEGELLALEEKIDFLRPAGPWSKFRHPKDVVRDPDATESDLSDCKWVMVADYVATAYINAVYRDKRGDGEWANIYQPTHVVGTSNNREIEDQINSFSLIKENDDYKTYGYNNDESYRKACRTKVWYVWDKITRRVYMFNDKDWTWPIWVWDDPYHLDTFYPIYPLSLITDPEDDIGQSEVMYYLDQQDAINDINNEKRRIRRKLMGSLFYNKNLIKDRAVVDRYMSDSSEQKAFPIDAPLDADMQKAFFALLPPAAQALPLLDKQDLYQAVDRVSSVMPVMRGQEFKTNTTNDAIDTYNSQQQTRLDEKIDAVEDWIGDILWGVVQLCLQFMSQQEVASVIGQADAQFWPGQPMTPEQITQTFSVRVVGGSTQKPTSKAKKQEAIQMGQTLGQFAQAGNGAAIMVMLKVFERAFDELVITKEDWQFLQGSIVQATANSNPQGQAPSDAAQPNATSQQPNAGPATQGNADPIQQMMALIDQLPPEAKEALGNAISRGVPMEEALPRIIELVQQATTGVPQ